MNSDHLARYYPTLTPWERLPLIVAACARGDRVEEDRLAHAAPKNVFRVPDYWGLAEGLDDLLKLYLLEQFDLAALYWRFTGLLNQEPLGRPSRQDRQREKRRWQLVQMLAYRCVVRADGWQLLCAELHLDPDVLAQQLPGYQAVQQMVQEARRIAFNAEEALAFLRDRVAAAQPGVNETPALCREYRLDTADDVARSMRDFLRARLDSWR